MNKDTPAESRYRRRLIQFSCGAASAVAAKLTIAKHGHAGVVVIRAFVEEEHEDNGRFSSDVQAWLAHPITIIRDEKYGASVMEVWRRERYIKGPNGASCARAVKRKPLAAFTVVGDILVVGFTAEEENRAEDIRANNPGQSFEFPLIDASLGKSDCLAMVERTGIKLPEMYLLGFNNNNCIGCPKGGDGYWDRVRTHFPQRFYQIADIQEAIGPGAYFLKGKDGGRMKLRDLPVGAGRHREPEIACSFFCDIAEQDIAALPEVSTESEASTDAALSTLPPAKEEKESR